MISNAVGQERISRVVGYLLQTGNFQESTPNLPMRIAILGQANTDKQSGLQNTPVEVTSASQAGELFGFGSPIHQVMRILRNPNGDATGGIPTVIYPQVAPTTGPAAEVQTITVSGTPAGQTTHQLFINGRGSIDGGSYAFTVLDGDTLDDIAQRIADTINAVNSAPVTATVAAAVVTVTTKWVGTSAGDLNLRIDTGNNTAGVAYAVAETTPAAGDSSGEITTSLGLFGDNWNTIVINTYGKSALSLFEAVNGVAGSSSPVGRYLPTTFKPFVALFGDTTADTVANAVTGLSAAQNTNVQCPAPNSEGWPFEAAANFAVLSARRAQDVPHGDISGQFLPDMPMAPNEDLGIYRDYNNRDSILKQGGSNVSLNSSQYLIEDYATTYHPSNENPPQFRYVRTLIIDWNIRFAVLLLEQIYVVDKTIVGDNDDVAATDVISPKQWRGELVRMFRDLVSRGLITDADFSAASLQVSVSTTNPDRFETFFRYKRTGLARISSTTAEAGFNFG